jgi:hypothetical protein
MPNAKKAYVSDGVNWLPLVSGVPDMAGYATTEYVDDRTYNLFPSQIGNSGKFLTTSGSVTSWATLDLTSAINTASAAAVTYLVDSAPGTLDTLNELAAALGDDANYATTITALLATKLNTSTASSTYLTQASASTTYATQAALNSINGESDQFILPSQIFG